MTRTCVVITAAFLPLESRRWCVGIAMLVCVAFALPAHAQQRSADSSHINIFLDCESCDFDYIRTETRWAEFVRDRTAADAHVLVTRIETGSGGREYTLEITGIGLFAGHVDTARYVSPPSHTEDETRQGLTAAIHRGIYPLAIRTPVAPRLRIALAGDDESEQRPAAARDGWNAWVFEIGVDGSFEREQRQRQGEVGADVEARRVTSMWKTGIEIEANQRQSRFELETRTVTSKRESFGANAVVVRSVGAHWGIGAGASIGSSTFENTRRAVRAAPAIEYSLWPYEQATRRQLTLQYSVGVSAYDYREETIFGRTSETRPTHTFVAGYDVRQRWGSANAELEYSNYMDNSRQYRLEFDGELSFRIMRGLELELSGSASQIRDQLSIARRDATDDEVLLELRDLQTDYRFNASIGFSFTFGSLFNSVVNPRFGSGTGSVLR